MTQTVGQAPCPPEVRRAYEYLTSSAASAQRKAGESGRWDLSKRCPNRKQHVFSEAFLSGLGWWFGPLVLVEA